MKTVSLKWMIVGGFAALLVMLLIGCGGGGGGGGGVVATPKITVTTTASATQGKVAYGATDIIDATVAGVSNGSVTFKISPAYSKFTVNGNQAVFTAPSTAGSYNVTITSVGNSSLTETFSIVVVPITLQITPKSATVSASGTVLFNGVVQGSANTQVNYSPAGSFTAVPGDNSAATYKAPATAGTYTITATAAASAQVTTTATVTVTTAPPSNATVKGKVTDTAGANLSGVVIQFFDVNGNQVAQATTASTGAFTATVPTTALSFNLASATINTAQDYEAFYYGTSIYDPLIAGCNAPLPTLSSNGTTTLGPIEVAAQSGPPPPPTGCS